jgi:hypothetical protein
MLFNGCVRDYFTIHLFLEEFSEFHLKLATKVAWIARQHLGKRAMTTKYIALFSRWWHAIMFFKENYFGWYKAKKNPIRLGMGLDI